MPNMFDPIEGEPLRDFLGYLQNANARSAQQRSQQATNSKLDHIANLLAQQQAEQARQAALPPCPYCHGKLEGTPELCRHCRSNLSWVEGYPCKPGNVAALKRKIDETKRVLAEERARKEEARKLEEARQLEEARIKHENKTRELETANKRWFIVVLVGTTVALLLDIYWR